MKNQLKTLMMLAVYLFFLIFFTPSISAQTKTAQHWVCLKADWCIDQDAFAQKKIVINPLCAPELDAKGNPVANGHRVRLTAKEDAKPLPNKDTYIVECLATVNGQVCTTGSPTVDNVIYGKDNSAALNQTDDYQFQGIFTSNGKTPANNPEKSKTNGDINPVEWQSYSKGNERKFLALNYFDPNGTDNLEGKGGQQQGTFSFEVQSNLKNCLSINWDPYGRVFDSQTLEPIPNASIELLQKKENGLFSRLLSSELLGGAIENPYTTKENGYFSFIVPNATYKLSVLQQYYTFPSNLTKLNQAYTKAYSDIYPNNTGLEIVQAGSIQHRDIPLDPKGTGFNYPVKLVEYFYNLDKTSNKIVIEGLMSHPLTKIKLYSLKTTSDSQILTRYRLIKAIQADRYGKFKTEIDQSLFEPTEIFGDMEFEKVDLTKQVISQQNFFNSLFSVSAAQFVASAVRFSPILEKLQGYAYDEKKQIIPQATVGIYLSYANKPFYETKADEQGLYTVNPDNLPDTPYTIKYSSPVKAATTVTTTKFLAQNISYLTSNKINLNSTAILPSLKAKTDNSKSLSNPSNTFSNLPTRSIKQPVVVNKIPQNKLFVFIGIILLILIGGVGLMLGVYVFKKNKQP